ncbi:hypothetical protein OIN78_17880, partial [Acinetobacter baumannii]|nr:hypothetical protein [Acinetobacter baumannii]
SGTGVIKRSVNVVDVFSGGTVSANPAATATANSVANTMGVVAVDVFNNYKLPITVIGNKAQKVIEKIEADFPFFFSTVLKRTVVNYDEGINVKKIQVALPSTLKGFGDGDFEVELSIDGQVYKKSVAAGSSLVEIALDNNTDKFLGGKTYTVKIYKRTSVTTTELVMSKTNSLPSSNRQTYFDYGGEDLPPIHYSKVGDLFEFEEQTVNQEGTLNNYSHLMMKNIPTGTSRVEVKYKVAGASQWSSLTSSAALYNNTAGWYKAGLSTLENNKLYDYQYLAYNAKGEILGGGQGVINTALNQATITQKALAATDLPSVYVDKQETVNTKQDVISIIYGEGPYGGVSLRLKNQPVGTTQVICYYRELGSNVPYGDFYSSAAIENGNTVTGLFDLNFYMKLVSTKKYEIQYIAYAGNNIVNRQQGTIEFTSAGMQVNVTPLNYGGDGFILFGGTSIDFIDQFKPVTSASTSAKLKIRKVGTAVWEESTLTSTSGWFKKSGGNYEKDGEYEFQLDSFNGTAQTTPSGSIIGKLRLGSQPKVLSYIPKS